MKIRAAVLEDFGQPLVVEEHELAEPKEREALVRLAAFGVCHTDLYTASGAHPGQRMELMTREISALGNHRWCRISLGFSS